MATLAEIRQQYPQYQDLSDQELADGLYRSHYSDMPREEFNRRLGLTTAPGTSSQLARGVEELLQTPSQLLAAGRSFFISPEEAAQEREVLQQRQQEIAARRPAAVENLADVTDITSFGQWLSGAVGRAAPSMVPGLVGGVAGALVGGPIGAAIGFGAGSLGPNVAESYMGIGEQPSAGTAVGAGIVKSALDALPSFRLFRSLLGNVPEHVAVQAIQRGVLRTLGREVPRQTAYEGLAEGGQDVVDQLADRFVRDNWEALTSDNLLQVAESALVGSVLGGAGAAVTTPSQVAQGRRIQEQQEQAAQAEEGRAALLEQGRQQQELADQARAILVYNGAVRPQDVGALSNEEAVARAQQWMEGDPFEREAARQAAREGREPREGRRFGDRQILFGDEPFAAKDPLQQDTEEFGRRAQAQATGTVPIFRESPESRREQAAEQFTDYAAMREDAVPPAGLPGVQGIQVPYRGSIPDLNAARELLAGVPEGQSIDAFAFGREAGWIVDQLQREGLVRVLPSTQSGAPIVTRTGTPLDQAGPRPTEEQQRTSTAERLTGRSVARPSAIERPLGLTPEQISQELGSEYVEAARREREAGMFPQAARTINRGFEEQQRQLRDERVRAEVDAENAAIAKREARQRISREVIAEERAAQAERARRANEAVMFPQARSQIMRAPGSPTEQRNTARGLQRFADRWAGGDVNVRFGQPEYLGGRGALIPGKTPLASLSAKLTDPQLRYTAMHEIGAHGLMQLGKISPAEWKAISTNDGIMRMMGVVRWAHDNGHPTLSATPWATIDDHVWRNRISPVAGREEALAFYLEAMLWARDNNLKLPNFLRAQPNILKRAVEVLRRFFNKLARGLAKNEEELAQRIFSGEIGRRPRGQGLGHWAGMQAPTLDPTVAASIDEVERLNTGKTDDFTRLRLWNKVINTPDYIAAKYREFRPYMLSKARQEEERSKHMHEYLKAQEGIGNLTRPQRANVARLAEVAGAMQTTPQVLPDGTIRLKVPEYAPRFEKGKLNSLLFLSKPGDVITLSREEAAAYIAQRQVLDKVFEDIKTSTLARFDLPSNATPDVMRARSRELAKEATELAAAGDQAGHIRARDDSRRLLTAAGMLEVFDRSFLEAYTPHMRAGKAKLVIMQAERNPDGSFKRDSVGNFIPDEGKQENPLTRTVVIPFDGATLNGAKNAADKYKRQVAGRWPASAGWVMQVKANDMGSLVGDNAVSQRGLNAIETLANAFFADKRSKDVIKDEAGNVLTPLDIFLDQLHRLEPEITKRGMKAHLRRRKDNAGWLRPENAENYLSNAVGAYLVRAADHVADNLTAHETKKAMQSLIQARRPDLHKYASEMENYIRTPDRFTSMLKGWAFNWFLGFRLSSAFINMLQPLQSTIPLYSTFAGGRRASMEVLRAGKDVTGAFLRGTPQNFRNLFKDGNAALTDDMYFDWKRLELKLLPDEIAMLRQGQTEGWLANVMTHEQSGAVEPPIDNKVKAGIARIFGDNVVKPLLKAAPIFFSMAEQQNRTISALAAYRLAKDPAMLAKIRQLAEASYSAGQINSPLDAAKFLTKESNFMISKANRPMMTRDPVGAIALQFMQFPLAMFQLWARVLKGAGIPKRAIGSFLTMAAIGAMLTSGMWGLPGMGDLSEMFKVISRTLGPIIGVPEINLERSAQEMFSRTIAAMGMNQENAALTAEALVKGPWRSTFGVDISRRAAVRADLAEFFTTDATNLIGPAGSMIAGSARDFMGYAANAQWPMAAASLLPMAARDLVKAFEARQGFGVPGTTGNVRVPAHVAGLGEYLALGAGFQPASYARESERRDIAEGRGVDAMREYYRQQLVDALVAERVNRRDRNESRARASRERANAIRQAMQERSRGRPADERVWTSDTMRLVNRRVADAMRGPAATALKRRRNDEEALVRERLRLYPQ